MSFTELVRQNDCWRDVAPTKPRLWKKGHRFNSNQALMYFLVSGRVRLTALARNGSEKTLWYLSDGCCFNETPMFNFINKIKIQDMGNANFYHECAEDSYLCVFSAEDVCNIGRERPDMLLNLCKSYAVKLTLLSQHVVSLSLESQLTRVCKFLASRIVVGSEPLRARRDISYRDMADLLGMHRITLYKVMRQAQAKGLISFDKSSDEVFILRPAEFYREADLPCPPCFMNSRDVLLLHQ